MKKFDISGRLIMTLLNEYKTAGSYEVNFRGKNLSSGVYYYKVESGKFSSVRKIVLLK
ncbi:MAG: T9SS type A sorting domain-containing protein [Ignavibacteria bacterium]